MERRIREYGGPLLAYGLSRCHLPTTRHFCSASGVKTGTFRSSRISMVMRKRILVSTVTDFGQYSGRHRDTVLGALSSSVGAGPDFNQSWGTSMVTEEQMSLMWRRHRTVKARCIQS